MILSKKNKMEFFFEYAIMQLELLIANKSDDKSLIYDKMYVAITSVYKESLIKYKPKELSFAIKQLIQFYQSKEEYEKCHKLNQVGYEIYNTIID
jgi:hypothetical protein